MIAFFWNGSFLPLSKIYVTFFLSLFLDLAKLPALRALVVPYVQPILGQLGDRISLTKLICLASDLNPMILCTWQIVYFQEY